MEPFSAVEALETSFARKLRIPGAKVASSEVSDATWRELVVQNKQAIAIKVLGKQIMSIKKTLEIFTGVLWARAEEVTISFEGEDAEGSRFFLAKFGSASDLANIFSRSPWTVGAHLVILEAYDPLKKVSEHGFQTCPVWLQIHGLPPFAAKNKEIIMSLAGKAGDPVEKSLIYLQEFSKIKVMIDHQAQLTSGAFLKRPKQTEIPVLFRYEKAGIICFRCAYLGHKEKVCKHQSFLEGSPSAFSFLEGFPAADSPSMNRRTSASGKAQLSGENIGREGKLSAISPKNLLKDLDACLLGSGSRIAEVDLEQEILPSHLAVNVEHGKNKSPQEKSGHESMFPRIGTFHPAHSGPTPVEHLNTEKTEEDSQAGQCAEADVFGQTYVFKAESGYNVGANVSLHVTPYLIKKTRKVKGPGPIWQRVPIGISSMRKRNSTLISMENFASDISWNSAKSLLELSENSAKQNANSNRCKLLEWSGNFSNFTEQEEESEPEEEATIHAGTKRCNRQPADSEVQTSQLLLAWKRLKPGPSASV